MKTIQYTFITFMLVVGLLTSCANSDDVAAPEIEFHVATATITLEELRPLQYLLHEPSIS